MASEEITISDLTPVSSVNDNDNLLIEDSTQTKRVTAHTLSEYIKEDISFDDLLDEEDAIVPVNKGGTGASTVEAARDTLGLGNTSGALPVANGGTGASSALGARSNLGLGSVATESIVPVSKGGTGKSSITSDTVLVGNGTNTPTERTIDTTSGGTANSNALITSGAVNSKVREMQSTFQDGVDTIYNAIVAEGVTPSASTPQALATGIGTIASNKYAEAQAVTWKETFPASASTTESVGYFYVCDCSNIKSIMLTNITKSVNVGALKISYCKYMADSSHNPYKSIKRTVEISTLTEYLLPTDIEYDMLQLEAHKSSGASAVAINFDMNITHQAKKLR